MEQKIKLLVAMPMCALLFFGLISTFTMTRTLIHETTSSFNQNDAINTNTKESSCESCPDYITKFPCSVTGDSVLGGLDFVQYFVDFKLDDGSYNETQIGIKGQNKIYSVYNNFTYNFLSQENKLLFEENPEKYIPQWGGYCAWGISGEYCPEYPWDSDCLGPSGNWGHWTIVNEKLYFFLFSEAKNKFTIQYETSDLIAAGDARWEDWFHGEKDITPMSTSCYQMDD